MKNRVHLPVVTALSLALFVTLSGLQAAPMQAGKNSEQGNKTTENKKSTERKAADANPDQQQMRDLDEQVQQTKSDVLSIAAELNQLEEKLLYPSGTQVAIFVALAKGDQMRLDAVRLQIDGQLVAHYIYSAKELEALRKGGVQRIYVGNVAAGDHQLNVLVDGKLKGGADFNRTEHFTFHKEVKPKMVELTVAGSDSGSTPITLGEL
jgi:TolA-binding protein